MNRRMAAATIALAVIGAGLTACGDEPGAVSSPTVTSKTSATASKAPTPTPSPTPTEDPLFTEAKAVHLKYLEASFRLDQQGGASRLPESMKSLVGGEYATVLEKVYSDMYKEKIHADRGSSWKRVSVWQRPAKSGFLVALGSCVDFRNVTYRKESDGSSSRGSWILDELQFRRVNGSLVIVDGSSRQVKSCGR